MSIGAEGSLPQLRTPAVKGRMGIDAALARLLAGSGYVARQVGPSAWRIERARAAASSRAPANMPTPRPVAPPETIGQPIIVTGSKVGKELVRLPMAVQVVRFGLDHVPTSAEGSASIAQSVEGLSLSGQGPGRNRMFLRGIADSPFNGGSQSTVAVVLDESRVTFSAPDPDLRLVDVDQVEILKGPQGSLYGSGALGGIYRITTGKPELGEASLSVSSGGEVIASGNTGYSLTAVGNLPIAGDSTAVRLVFYGGYDAGWIDTGLRDDSNGTRIFGMRGTLRTVLGGSWEAELGGALQMLNSEDTQYVYAPGKRRRPAQLAEPHDNDFSHGALRITGDIGAAKLVVSSGYTAHQLRDVLDATVGATQFGLRDPRRLVDDRTFRLWDTEVRLNGRWGAADWLVGVAHLEALQTLALTLDSGTVPTMLSLDDNHRTNADTALFGDMSLPLTDTLRFDAGGRMFTSTSLESRSTAIGLVARRQTKRGFTPSLALSWSPRSERLIYLRYGSAFRPGGADIAADGTLAPLASDELQTIETGWRESLAGGGSLALGTFYSRWENIQSDLLQTNGLFESANVGNGEIAGFEASATLPLAHSWTLETGATFTHAVLVQVKARLGTDDLRLPVVPEYTVRMGLNRSFDLAGAPARFGVQLRYVGPSRLSFDALSDRPMGKVLESSLTARAQLFGGDIEIAIDNLFDRRGNVFAFGNPLRFASGPQFTPQAPFSVRVTLQRTF